MRSLVTGILRRHIRQLGSRGCHSTVTMTGSAMDANTVFHLDRYSRYIPAAISIKHLLDHGKSSNQLGSYLFLKKEIPTRLANMIMELQLLPEDLKKQNECSQILNDYVSSFREMLVFDGDKTGSKAQLELFSETLNVIRRRHLDTVPRMATAVFKMTKINSSEGVSDTVQYFLDRLYINRISIHMLISQHHALIGEESITGMVGTIEQQCNVLKVVEDAYNAARVLCEREYLDSPRLKATCLDTTDSNPETRDQVSAAMVPAHLHHIMFEILKNAMRATCEFAESKGGEGELPYIRLKIYKTKNDITIKVSDIGGGIPRASSGKVFNYMYSTAPQVVLPSDGGSYGAGLSGDSLPMHGLGYGLPLSRLYSRYFKGDIQIASVDGYGTDVYVYMQRLSHMAQENLPVYNAVSSAKLRNIATQVRDWTDLGGGSMQ